MIAHADRLTVARRAGADDARVESIARGVLHHARRELAVELDADRDAERGVSVDVVRRPVERVDDPADARTARVFGRLLAEDGIVGPFGEDRIDDHALGLAIDLGHHVGRARLGVHLLHTTEPGSMHAGAGPRGPGGENDERGEIAHRPRLTPDALSSSSCGSRPTRAGGETSAPPAFRP